jgi:peptidoglycan/LPS O-acetylase OafA/YrhL
MTPGISLYLDLLRYLMAMAVVVYHVGRFDTVGLGENLLTKWGHEAVVVFFVLSGYVIQHAARSSVGSLSKFSADRISRIYAVAIPCLLLTVVFETTGRYINPAAYVGVGNGAIPIVLLWSVLFLNESWLPLYCFTNAPYWSLCYEVWFYVLFAAFYFLSGWTRAIALTVAALLAGPWILLLLPVWLLGCAAYKLQFSRATYWTWLALLQPILVFWLYEHFELRWETNQLVASISAASGVNFRWSSSLFSDYLLGASLALHLMAAKCLDERLARLLNPFKAAIRWGADRSFTLYLLHFPLVYMLSAAIDWFPSGPLRPTLILILTISVPLLFAPMIESQRYRLRPVVLRMIQRYSGRTQLAPTNQVHAAV